MDCELSLKRSLFPGPPKVCRAPCLQKFRKSTIIYQRNLRTGVVPIVATMVLNVAQPDEPELIRLAQNGNREAFAALVDKYWDRLYRWLFHLTRDRHAAEDLAQESFLKAFTALAHFKPPARFQAWLFRIAHNAWVNTKRVRIRVWQSYPEEVPAEDHGPAELAMNREALKELTLAVGRLPSDYRAAFLLRVEQDLSFREIADVLEITEENARWRVFKARQKLMEVMEKHLE
jgi:RNA polymerase sigma-70 factor, ECF subfamily